jgi:hypothetical protein
MIRKLLFLPFFLIITLEAYYGYSRKSQGKDELV